MRKLPWFSLTLLFVTYTTWGWILSAGAWQWLFQIPDDRWVLYRWFLFLMAAIAVLVLTEGLAAPWSGLRKLIVTLLISDTKAFIAVLVAAFFAAIVLVWFHIFIQVLILIAAGILARLDLQREGFKAWYAFGVLAIVSLAGLALGWMLNYYLYPLYVWR